MRKMISWPIGIALIILVLIVVVIGCGPKKPPTGEVLDLEFYSSPVGAPPYLVSLATSEMLNELHPWLRAKTLEGIATAETLDAMDALPPERKKHTFINSLVNTRFPEAQLGLEPFSRKFTDLKLVSANPPSFLTFCTYDPNIRTPDDLRGKRIGMFAKAAGPASLGEAILRDAWGIYDDVNISRHSPMGFKDALITGIADAAFAISILPQQGGTYTASPFTSLILGAKKTYWLNITPEDVQRANEKNVFTASHAIIPKDAVGEGYPPADSGHTTLVVGWFCWEECPDEVVYELVKFSAENDQKRSKRAQGLRMGAEYLAAWPGLTEDQLHPGALRYYKEHNIKIGL